MCSIVILFKVMRINITSLIFYIIIIITKDVVFG